MLRPLAVLLVLVVVVAGCTAPTAGPAASGDDASGNPPPSDGVAGQSTATPAGIVAGSSSDATLGWEDGYWYDDALDVDASDGLTDAEFAAYLARAMARVEYLRGHEFTRPIRIETVTREELRARIGRTGSFAADEPLPPERVRIANGFWEALFLVGEDEDALAVRADEGGSFLGAYYVAGTDTIRLVTDGGPRVVDERLLVHELVHALQDGYGGPTLTVEGDDAVYAAAALIEGDATVVERQFAARCQSGAWSCVTVETGTAGSADVHQGFRALRSFAYSDGPAFVARLHAEGGWVAVDEAFQRPPRTTAEIIHPEHYPSAVPEPLDAPAPDGGWSRIGGPYTTGEVELFVMLWYQEAGYGTRVAETAFARPDAGPQDRYNYTSAPSAGWDGDALWILARGDETGYVWLTRWETAGDAAEFHAAYLATLRGHGAEPAGDRTWVIPAGPYADAFYVERRGEVVAVANAPTVADLDAVYPPADP